MIAHRYDYDQLHRIKEMSRSNFEIVDDFGSVSLRTLRPDGYSSNYSYDPNGNLQSLERYTNWELRDELSYRYDGYDNNGEVQYSDRLQYVEDDVVSATFPDDFDGQAAENYRYDGAGNLIADVQQGTEISWNPYGKVTQIQFNNRSNHTFFDYGPDQNRVAKTYFDVDNNQVRTKFYVRDAQGNCLAVYEQLNGSISWEEQHLYGSNRLGVWRSEVVMQNGDPTSEPYYTTTTPNRRGYWYTGRKTYELSNHLGNVTNTISDRKNPQANPNGGIVDHYLPVVRSATEYYPFGLEMPGRTLNFGKYRFGFNGKEADTQEEWGSQTHYDYGFRIYNPSIARFLSVDPLMSSYPWNSTYAFAENDVIRSIDVDGAEAQVVIDKYQEILKNHSPAQGNRVVLSPARETVHSSNSNPAPICCDVQFRKEDRPQAVNYDVGGLDGYSVLTVPYEGLTSGQELKLTDNYTPAYDRWMLTAAQSNLRQSNLDFATFFGPGIFTGGKFSLKFLQNTRQILRNIGVPRFSVRAASSGFSSNKARQTYNAAFRRIKNNIDHLQDQDLSGAIKDIHGFPSNGNHLNEVNNAITGLGKARSSLQELINSGSLADEALETAQRAMSKADEARRHAVDILNKATRSAKKHASE